MSCENEIIEINLSKVTEVIEVSYEGCEHVVNINSAEGIDPGDYDLADFQNGNTNYFIQLDQFVDGLDGKVDKVVGETLIPIAALDKLNGIEANAQVNIIEKINVNGVALVVGVDKSVNIIIPDYSNSIQHDVKLAQPINKGQAVYVSSATGTNIVVSKASNTSEATSSKTLGLLVSGGVTNDIVKVATEGLLAGLNTVGAIAGDPVWLGENGNLIFGLTNKPKAPKHLVYLGVVTRVNANNGEIFIHVQNGFELDELHDVLIENKLHNQGVYFDSASGLWKNEYRWEYLALNAKTDGVEHAATGGYYMEYSLHGNTIYRFITTNEDANGYPLEDSFYSNVSGGVLSNLIVTRS